MYLLVTLLEDHGSRAITDASINQSINHSLSSSVYVHTCPTDSGRRDRVFLDTTLFSSHPLRGWGEEPEKRRHATRPSNRAVARTREHLLLISLTFRNEIRIKARSSREMRDRIPLKQLVGRHTISRGKSKHPVCAYARYARWLTENTGRKMPTTYSIGLVTVELWYGWYNDSSLQKKPRLYGLPNRKNISTEIPTETNNLVRLRRSHDLYYRPISPLYRGQSTIKRLAGLRINVQFITFIAEIAPHNNVSTLSKNMLLIICYWYFDNRHRVSCEIFTKVNDWIAFNCTRVSRSSDHAK